MGDLGSDSSPDIQLYQPGHPSYRHFPALFYHLVWDLSDDGCYYVGNSQGGPERSRDPMNSVIEGSYSQYIVDGLFDTEFEYERFDENACWGRTFQDRVPLFVVWTKSVRVCYLFLIAWNS